MRPISHFQTHNIANEISKFRMFHTNVYRLFTSAQNEPTFIQTEQTDVIIIQQINFYILISINYR